ncbi:hypothetical protein E2C01_038803 [Portunus trituberculatus]|uniref:Uncharacterized protein n=1 Tax=Portunus trituberculatus TaxID=210409 RepID=A0A5B7FHW1_PORTR|nr:hypothetical protein [Portunus trituberculatus]
MHPSYSPLRRVCILQVNSEKSARAYCGEEAARDGEARVEERRNEKSTDAVEHELFLGGARPGTWQAAWPGHAPSPPNPPMHTFLPYLLSFLQTRAPRLSISKKRSKSQFVNEKHE